MEPTQQQEPPPVPRPKHPGVTGGLVLIAIGVLFLLDNVVPDFHFGDYWPLILIAVGVGLLWNSRRA